MLIFVTVTWTINATEPNWVTVENITAPLWNEKRRAYIAVLFLKSVASTLLGMNEYYSIIKCQMPDIW